MGSSTQDYHDSIDRETQKERSSTIYEILLTSDEKDSLSKLLSEASMPVMYTQDKHFKSMLKKVSYPLKIVLEK